MTLRKITIDNSVRYIPKSEQTKEREIKPKKTRSIPCKQNENISQSSKKFVKNVAASGFGVLTKKYVHL